MATTLVALVSACGQPESPQLSMCQSVTKNLVGSVEWGDSEIKESTNRMTVNASYVSDGTSGKVSCVYPRERTDDGNGKFATAPESVSVNGERVSTGDLLRAGTKASKAELEVVAKETARQTEIVAREAGEKAGELAGQAQVIATEAGAKVGEAASQAATQAGEVAGQLGQQAEQVAREAGKKIQDALEKQ